MKVYGFDCTGSARGKLRAAQIDAFPRSGFSLEQLAGELGWDYADTSFARARGALLQAMDEQGTDADLVRLVRRMKSYDVPVEDAR